MNSISDSALLLFMTDNHAPPLPFGDFDYYSTGLKNVQKIFGRLRDLCFAGLWPAIFGVVRVSGPTKGARYWAYVDYVQKPSATP